MQEKKTASYKTVADGKGYRFLFYCDASDAHVCTTKKNYQGELGYALLEAWQSEGYEHFNRCHRCGRWVIDAVYNVEVLECVMCAPYEAEPNFCKNCGAKVETPATVCPSCGKKLIYEGRVMSDDSEGSL